VKSRALESILAYDHHSATATSLEQMRERPALILTHGTVVGENDVYLYVSTGGNGYDGDDLHTSESIDCVAIVKSAIVRRTAHALLPLQEVGR